MALLSPLPVVGTLPLDELEPVETQQVELRRAQGTGFRFHCHPPASAAHYNLQRVWSAGTLRLGVCIGEEV